jgi:hypothetical protein
MSEQPLPSPPPPQQPMYVQQIVSPEVQSTATIALVLELVFGLFGALGLGNIYAKRTGLGIAIMLGWWVYLAVAIGVTLATVGIAGLCFGPIGLAIPIISGVMVRSYALQQSLVCDSSDLVRTLAIGIGVVVFVCLASCGILSAFGMLPVLLGGLSGNY